MAAALFPRPPRLSPVPAPAAIATGALLLIWPALLNRYPILFSDTGGLMEMGLAPSMGWDKPWVYGPLLALCSLWTTLWLPLLAQGVLTSGTLWLTQAAMRRPSPGTHVAVCAALAVVSAAPWFTATLMPDVFTPVVVLSLFVLTFGAGRASDPAGPGRLSRPSLLTAGTIATAAIAAHLSHLIVAAACIAAALLLRPRHAWRPAVPLAAALAFLLASNAVGHGRIGISPYGSVFALARLVGDGPARAYIDRVCPAAGYRLCAWKGRLSADSDEFLWHPEGPLWADEFSPLRFAPEAARIVAATVAADPLAVLHAALANAGRQLLRVAVGDTLGPDYLDAAVLPRIQAFLPAAEARRYAASRQRAGGLAAVAANLRPLHLAALVLGAATSAWLALRHWRRPSPSTALAVMVLAGVLANAAATGPLSTVHDRYQARIAWLLLLPPAMALLARRGDHRAAPDQARLATSSGDMRTSAS